MAPNLPKLSILFFLLSVVNPFPFVEPRALEASEDPFAKTLQHLKGVHKGQKVKGVCKLKSYLQKFGYLTNGNNSSNDNFDQNVESALKEYQAFHHLCATGYVHA
ncbi:Metalloendoproteinase 5-MMP [Spatholobus suberectus]|nr:Metalloendoproteinase 5-MMP [Spatholobus suberectus]